jgi:PKD repeat protein
MKRLLIIIALVPILFTSCVRNPYADFIANKKVVEIGESVYFTNRSLDSHQYDWDFGDGYYSGNFNASHSWDEPGFYTVTLTSYGKDGRSDIAAMTIEVLSAPECDLEVTVEEYFDPYYLVEDARVRLYPTIQDWENETNMIVQGYTNSSGKVRFIDVPIPLNGRVYVDVYGAYHDNLELAAIDAIYIETDLLTANALNYFTALVYYYPDGKKSAVDSIERKVFKK